MEHRRTSTPDVLTNGYFAPGLCTNPVRHRFTDRLPEFLHGELGTAATLECEGHSRRNSSNKILIELNRRKCRIGSRRCCRFLFVRCHVIPSLAGASWGPGLVGLQNPE